MAESVSPTTRQVQDAYALAKARYAALGVDTDQALATLGQHTLEASGDYTARLALVEELKGLLWGAVWDQFCLQRDVPVGIQFLDEVKAYETRELAKRVN